jgi:hypothetical protein
MHDTVALEQLGVPTALIVTSEFVHEAMMQRAALGLPSLETAVIDHPLSTLSQNDIEQRAAQAVGQVKAIWLTGHVSEAAVGASSS